MGREGGPVPRFPYLFGEGLEWLSGADDLSSTLPYLVVALTMRYKGRCARELIDFLGEAGWEGFDVCTLCTLLGLDDGSGDMDDLPACCRRRVVVCGYFTTLRVLRTWLTFTSPIGT